MRDLRIEVDKEARAVYVTVTDAPIVQTVEAIKDKVLVDLDTAGAIVGIEVLDVTLDGVPALLHALEDALLDVESSMGRDLAIA